MLYQHPAVREAAVVGVPDDYRGETVKAFVSLRPGEAATEAELIAFCKERMAAYKYPRSIEFVDELPKTVTGKILRRELRAGRTARRVSRTAASFRSGSWLARATRVDRRTPSRHRSATRPEPGGSAAASAALTARGARTRAALVKAARALFERKGYLDTNVGDIAKRASVAHGTFYTYFSSKEEIFGEVADELQHHLLSTSPRPSRTCHRARRCPSASSGPTGATSAGSSSTPG